MLPWFSLGRKSQVSFEAAGLGGSQTQPAGREAETSPAPDASPGARAPRVALASTPESRLVTQIPAERHQAAAPIPPLPHPPRRLPRRNQTPPPPRHCAKGGGTISRTAGPDSRRPAQRAAWSRLALRRVHPRDRRRDQERGQCKSSLCNTHTGGLDAGAAPTRWRGHFPNTKRGAGAPAPPPAAAAAGL